MKRIAFLLLCIIAAVLASCGSHDEGKETPKKFPKPGTIVASAEMPVKDDPLNNFIFSVKVVADSSVSSGVYDVDADYGPNFAEGQFTMPKGGEDLTPIIKKGSSSNFIIGFKVAGDTTFYDYFEVSGNKKSTKMEYIKAYSF